MASCCSAAYWVTHNIAAWGFSSASVDIQSVKRQQTHRQTTVKLIDLLR